jgi:hypothetical protein
MSSSAVRPFTSFGLHPSSPDRIDIVQLWEEWSNEIERSSRSGLRRHADGRLQQRQPGVKQFAQMMIDDHGDAVRDLRSRVDENRSVTDRLTGKNPENPAAVKPEPADDHVKASINEVNRQHASHDRTPRDGLLRAGQPERAHRELAMVQPGRFIQRAQQGRQIDRESPFIRPCAGR